MWRWPALVALVVVAACGEDARAPAPSGEERVVEGDTTVVRSLGQGVWADTMRLVEELRIGAVDGEDWEQFGRVSALAVADDGTIYVADQHGPTLRRYASDGSFLGQMGHEGSGPGEYRDPDGGLSVLPDGRVLLRDPPNARINVYSPEGEVVDHWRQPGIRTSRPLYVDDGGHGYNLVMVRPGSVAGPPEFGLAKIDGAGLTMDTLMPPVTEHEDPMVRAGRGDQTNAMPVPFTSRFHWTFSSRGYFVHGVSDRYAIYLDRPEGPMRIERPAADPVPVLGGEAASLQNSITRNMRNTEPAWRWDGPPIPETKPPFKGLNVGMDGRIWVRLHHRATRVVERSLSDEEDPPREQWVEPLTFDVFEPDGTYLGAVTGPTNPISFWASPVMRGDNLWAVTFDDLDVAYIVRYRIERPGS